MSSTAEEDVSSLPFTTKSVCQVFCCVPRVFQRVNDLPPTGELDEATLGVMRQPRCGMEDNFNKKYHKYSVMGESSSVIKFKT